MAASAFQTQYRTQSIDAFEQEQSLLRRTVTNEAVIKGNQAVFLVAGSGGATAVTRGINARIPARNNDLTQNTCTLIEWHDKVEVTGFNIFASQGNQIRIMQRTTQGVINRKIDEQIFDELDTTSVTTNSGGGVEASVDWIMHARTLLRNANVPNDGRTTCVISPAAHAYLAQTTEFSSKDYTTNTPFGNFPGMFMWLNITFIEHDEIPGIGTASEKCFMYHPDAIGHAANVAGMGTAVGYNDEDDYSYARCSMFMNAKVLQGAGIIEMLHNGAGFASA